MRPCIDPIIYGLSLPPRKVALNGLSEVSYAHFKTMLILSFLYAFHLKPSRLRRQQ